MSYSSEVLADSPLAYWKLDETSGTLATDSSGNSRTATYAGAASPGTSLLSDGSGHSASLVKNSGAGYATIASAAWQYPTAVTLECLVYFTGAPGSSGDALIWKGVNYRIWRDSSGNFACDVSNAGGGTKTIHSTTALANNTTYHLALTKDNTNLLLYVNGSLVADLVNNVGLGSGSSAAGSPGSGIYSGAATVNVGRATGDASIPTALVDEAAVYGTALSSTRLAAHYAAAVAAGAISGTLSAILPGVEGSFTGSYVPPSESGSFAAELPAPTASFAGTYQAPPEGTLSATLPLPDIAFSGTFNGAVLGTFATSLPVPSASFVGTYTPEGISGSVAATLPLPAVSFIGATLIEGAFAATLPILRGDFTGTYGGPYPTDTSNLLNGRDRRGSATVTTTRPVAAPPNTLTLAPKVDKAVALPTPTLVDGRPT